MFRLTLLLISAVLFVSINVKFSLSREIVTDSTFSDGVSLSDIGRSSPITNKVSPTNRPCYGETIDPDDQTRFRNVKKACSDDINDSLVGQRNRLNANAVKKRPPPPLKLSEIGRNANNRDNDNYRRLDEMDPEEREEKINQSFARLMQMMTFLGHVDNYLTDKASSLVKVMSKAMDVEESNNDMTRMSRPPCSGQIDN